MNSWPNGKRRAMTQDEHISWNASHFPGTRQCCSECGEYTGRCEEDALYSTDGEIGPLCKECFSACRDLDLVLAIVNDDTESVQQLLDDGADPNAADSYGWRPACQ